MALACTLAGCCHEDGTVCKDDIHLISGEINEEGNISLHFDLNTQYQGDLYVEMQPEGDEVNVFLYTPACGAELPESCSMRAVISWSFPGRRMPPPWRSTSRHEAGHMDKGVKSGSGGTAMFNGRSACCGQDG